MTERKRTYDLEQDDIGKLAADDTDVYANEVPSLYRRVQRIEALLKVRVKFYKRNDAYFVLVREGDRYFVLPVTSNEQTDWPPFHLRVRKSDISAELDFIDAETSGVIHSLTPGGPAQEFSLVTDGPNPILIELQAFKNRTEAMTALAQSEPFEVSVHRIVHGDDDSDATAVRPPNENQTSATANGAAPEAPADSSEKALASSPSAASEPADSQKSSLVANSLPPPPPPPMPSSAPSS